MHLDHPFDDTGPAQFPPLRVGEAKAAPCRLLQDPLIGLPPEEPKSHGPSHPEEGANNLPFILAAALRGGLPTRAVVTVHPEEEARQTVTRSS